MRRFFSSLFSLLMVVSGVAQSFAGAPPAAEFYRDPLIPVDPYDLFYYDEVFSTYESGGLFFPAYSQTDGSSRETFTAGNPAANPDVSMFAVSNGLDYFLGYGRERSGVGNGYDLFVEVRGGWTSPALSSSGNNGGATPNNFSQIQNMIPDYQDEGLYVLWEDGDSTVPSGATHLAHLNDNTGAIDWQETFTWRSVSMVPDGNDGVYVLRDSGPGFDGSSNTSVGILEHYTPAGKDLTFGGTGSVVVSSDAVSAKGGATLVQFLDGGFNYDDVFVIWADDDAVNPGIYARRFDETGAAHASFTNARGNRVVNVPNIDAGYFQSTPGLFQIHAKANPVIADDIVVGAAVLDGELSVFAFDADGVNLFPCQYNQVTPDFDQFDIILQYGNSGGDKGGYLIWEDGDNLNMSLINEGGESYWDIGGNTLFSSATLEVTLKSPGFVSNARGRYEGTSAVLDVSTNGGTLVYGAGGVGFTQYDFDEANFAQGPGGDCVAGAVPDAVVDLAAIPGDAEVSLSWSAPADNGSAITGYTVTYAPTDTFPAGSQTMAVATASALITGLDNGTSYRFQVVATNGVGNSAVSNLVDATPEGGSSGRRANRSQNSEAPWLFFGSFREAAQQSLGSLRGSAPMDSSNEFSGSADSSEQGSGSSQASFAENSQEKVLERTFLDDPSYSELLGAEGEDVLSILDLLIQLRRLFLWMQNDDAQLFAEYEVLAAEYHDFFLSRFFHQLVGVEYNQRRSLRSYDFDYREQLSEPTNIVVDFEKSVFLTLGRSCYDLKTLAYAEEIDSPEVPRWYTRYREFMKPWTDQLLGMSEYVPWYPVGSRVDDVLEALYLYVFGYCLPEFL